ncbi:APC family permease [Fodinibius halophilus]|uniref:Amino acid permease n=1 Tax=Fodinibius halophilus TaxID=1736908 RepID=A0A6M1T4N1_9BACT|nr:amino acid permease [Fodinibius halophilus]NGP86921.1 amino acid permease [Fodinibius halophilus]
MEKNNSGRPLPIFGNIGAIAVIVGIVVGIGIFRLPTMVAQNSASGIEYLSFWLAGGLISILGALCYAELAANHPDAGGEYHFLSEAFGPGIGFLFSWGRMTVIQTGSIALAAFILGDYATVIYDLGPNSEAIYAGCTVIGLTVINILGTRPSKNMQTIATTLIIGLLLVAGFTGLLSAPASAEVPETPASTSVGTAMIFVLLTYGGWNEGVYLSAELKDVRKNISRVLIIALGTITIIYLLVNSAYLHVLGLESLRNSDTIGVSLINQITGGHGSYAIAILVILSALSTANATIITGARTNYALGRDFPIFKIIGRWTDTSNAPVNALIVQGIITIGLVILGSFTQEAVSTMVDYTAPVFWFFFLLTTASLFIFRRQPNSRDRYYSVPLYPLTPIIFIIVCAYLLYSSIVFTGWGALLGIGILLLGSPFYFFSQRYSSSE